MCWCFFLYYMPNSTFLSHRPVPSSVIDTCNTFEGESREAGGQLAETGLYSSSCGVEELLCCGVPIVKFSDFVDLMADD